MITIKKNIKEFISLLDIIKNVAAETNFEFREEGLFVRFAHLSGFSLGLLTLKKSFFDEYTMPKETIIAIDTLLFYKIIKKLGKKELKIEITENGCEIKVVSGKSFFALKTYTVPKDERDIPKPNYESSWTIDCMDFFNLITEHLEFTTVARFESKDDTLKTTIKSNMISGEVFTTAVPILKCDTFAFYDISYLVTVLGIKSMVDKIEFSFGKDVPCKVGCHNEDITFEWYLAPRVGDED